MSIHHNSPGTGHHGLPGAENPILRHLESYWQSLRHARHIPARNEIAPQGIDAALPYAFILQRVGPGVARMRVAGQKIHELLCMDARGMPVSVLFAPNSREQLRASGRNRLYPARHRRGQPDITGTEIPPRPVRLRSCCCLCATKTTRPAAFWARWSATGQQMTGPAGSIWPQAARYASTRWRSLWPAASRHLPPPLSRHKRKGRTWCARPCDWSSITADQLALACASLLRRADNSSATRNASSSDCDAFRRGSQAV